MSTDTQTKNAEKKATSNKDIALHARITKKKQKTDINVNVPFSPTSQSNIETVKSLLQFSAIGMALISSQGDLLDVNDVFCNFIGYSKSDLLKYTIQELYYTNYYQEEARLPNEKTVKTLECTAVEKRYISRNNSILWGIETIAKVGKDSGTAASYIVQVVDKTSEQLLTNERNRANRELDAMRISITLTENRNNGLVLVNESGTLTNRQQGKYTDIPFEDCNLASIIQEIQDQLCSAIYETGAYVHWDLGVSSVRYPKALLESILYNLISNALQFVSDDRIPDIYMQTYECDGKVAISVKDNGIGINLTKNADKIFGKKSADHVTQNGHGAGLQVTKMHVESCGGSIEVKSAAHEGAEFIVTL